MLSGKPLWTTMLLTMLAVSGEVWAGDHERAHTLLEQGKVLPLSEIMEAVGTQIPGKVLEVELEEKQGLIVYKIEFLDAHDEVMEMLIDARTGKLISVERD